MKSEGEDDPCRPFPWEIGDYAGFDRRLDEAIARAERAEAALGRVREVRRRHRAMISADDLDAALDDT